MVREVILVLPQAKSLAISSPLILLMVNADIAASINFTHLPGSKRSYNLPFSLPSRHKSLTESHQLSRSDIAMFFLLWTLQTRAFYSKVAVSKSDVQRILETEKKNNFK